MNIKKKIFVSVPTSPANPYIHKHCVFSLLKLQQDPRYAVHIILPSHNPFENNLHHIVNDFLKSDCDFWLSFDYDNPPEENPLNLVELNKDIIGCPTPVLHYDKNKPKDRPVYYNVYKKVEGGYVEWEKKEGLQKVDAIGTGCFLASKRVFLNPDMQKGAFTRKLNEDGTVDKGNDISFCERAREAGFEIWAHYNYRCKHFSQVELNEMVEMWTNFYK